MAELSNLKHEKFCQEYVKDGVGSRAYRAAYGSDVGGADQAASRLLKRDDIQARLTELRSEVAQRNEITVDSLVQKYEYIYERRKDDVRGASAAVNAQNSIAKVTGIWLDKVQVSVENMTDEELAEAIKHEQGESTIPWAKVLEQSRGGSAEAPQGNGEDKQSPAAPTES